jgi:hypothetical protein
MPAAYNPINGPIFAFDVTGGVGAAAELWELGFIPSNPPGGNGYVQPNVTAFAVDPRIVQSGHTAVVQVAMCDGSARGVASTVTLKTWVAAVLPGDGTPLGSDW